MTNSDLAERPASARTAAAASVGAFMRSGDELPTDSGAPATSLSAAVKDAMSA